MRNGDDDLEDDFDFDQEDDDENMTNITQQRSNGDRESASLSYKEGGVGSE